MLARILRKSAAPLLISNLIFHATTAQAAPFGLATPLLATHIAPHQQFHATPAVNAPTSIHTGEKDKLQTYLQDVPQWLGQLDSNRYAELATQHFHQYENATDLRALSAALKNDFAQRLLAKYVEYSLLDRTGLWCDLALEPGSVAQQNTQLRYLLWLQGDYKTQDSLIETGIQLCQQQPQQAATLEYVSSTDDTSSDETLIVSLRSFQARHGIAASGKLDNQTVQKLSEPPTAIAQRIHLNLQRMQAINAALTGRHILANIPEFKLALREGSETVLELRTIVGKLSRPTPELNLQMTRVVINPSWGVPRKLATEDIIPAVLKDSTYLARKQFTVYRLNGTVTEVVPAESIDWSAAQDDFPYYLRQAPGENNVLGQFKFVTPNPRAIYLHDTNSRGLFNRSVRTFSSGCLRVENPQLLAQHVMQDTRYSAPEYLSSKLKSGKTRNMHLPEELPVYIVYWTTWVDAQGQLQQRPDIYQKDSMELAKPMFAKNDIR